VNDLRAGHELGVEVEAMGRVTETQWIEREIE
jgi:hypothetical protein